MLTDGRLANEDLTVNSGSGWIGWNMKETPKPFIIFDFLTKESSIQLLSIVTLKTRHISSCFPELK